MNSFCPNCGQQIMEEGTFCVNCGYNLKQNIQNNNGNQSVNYNQKVVNSNNNGMATAGFILGIVSLLCCCYSSFLSIIGFIFSIVGLNKAKECEGKGRGLAIAGIVINSISLFLMMVYFFIFMII